jgi:hypothetical protein
MQVPTTDGRHTLRIKRFMELFINSRYVFGPQRKACSLLLQASILLTTNDS